jgi:hypothetical protein
MRQVVADSNAIDPLAYTPGAYETIRAAIDDGRLEILFTRVTVDELAAIPDLARRSHLPLILIDLGRLVPTGAFVLDYSRLNFARLNDDTEAFEAFRSGNIEHTHDALTTVTAQVEHCAVVTFDKRLTARARDHGIEVLTPTGLLREAGHTGL